MSLIRIWRGSNGGHRRRAARIREAGQRQRTPDQALVDAYVLYEIAMRHVAEEGRSFPAKGKKQPAYNPWFTILKDANAMASAAEAELTITPRRRNNGGKVQKQKPSLDRRRLPQEQFPSDPTTRWARDVVDGRIVAG
jgi:phage terminase small subunit